MDGIAIAAVCFGICWTAAGAIVFLALVTP